MSYELVERLLALIPPEKYAALLVNLDCAYTARLKRAREVAYDDGWYAGIYAYRCHLLKEKPLDAT